MYVGKVSKTLQVFGPRQWQHSMLRGWHLSRPKPTSSVPLQYEFAFGGKTSLEGIEQVYEENPVGRGFIGKRALDLDEVIPAPQIEQPAEPVPQLTSTYHPAGLGPIAKHWLPRRKLCGTADEAWKETRWPLRPLDFDFRYYNCAPPGLVYPGYLQGNEDVLISGCSPRGPMKFSLPDIHLTVFSVEKNINIFVEPMKLDTLHINLISAKAYLTWRSTYLKNSPLDTVEILLGRL